MRSLLSVFTRCNQRPKALYRNVESLAKQSLPDYEQIFIVDGENRGIEWANKQLRENADRASGEYVLVLDDDDMMADSTVISELSDVIVEHNYPEMILFRMDHGESVLPDQHVWLKRPVVGRIGMSSWIVRRDKWLEFADKWQSETEADFHWLNTIWDEVPRRVWVDKVMTKCQSGRSWGSTE